MIEGSVFLESEQSDSNDYRDDLSIEDSVDEITWNLLMDSILHAGRSESRLLELPAQVGDASGDVITSLGEVKNLPGK